MTGVAVGRRGGLSRRAGATRPRRLMIAFTMVIGLLGAAAGLDATARFSDAVRGSQLAMSVTLPFLTALMAHDLRSAMGRPRYVVRDLGQLVVVVAAMACISVAWGLAAATGVTTATGHSVAVGDLATAGVSALAVQLTALLTGSGFGLLLSRSITAVAATVVVPLALYGALATVHAADWLTPYAVARDLLASEQRNTVWIRWTTVFIIWGLALNLFAALRNYRNRTAM